MENEKIKTKKILQKNFAKNKMKGALGKIKALKESEKEGGKIDKIKTNLRRASLSSVETL